MINVEHLNGYTSVMAEVLAEVHNIVQETGIKTIPKKEMQKGKMAVWGGLQIAVKKREVKSKREKEKYNHLCAEFQRITRRDKKAFLSDQRNRGKNRKNIAQ